MSVEWILGNRICAAKDSIERHLENHCLGWTNEQYLAIGERISNGEQGEHVGFVEEDGLRGWYTAVVRGRIDRRGRVYGILRTIFEVEDGA